MQATYPVAQEETWMLPVVKAQGKVMNTEHTHWCLDGGNALQNERFCGSVIHRDLLGAMMADHL